LRTTELTRLFPPSVELFTLSRLPAANGLPEGWAFKLPIGDQTVTAELFPMRPRELGAYLIRLSKGRPVDDWEAPAIDVLGDLMSFSLMEIGDIFESQAKGIAAMVHRVWTEGIVDALVPHLRTTYRTTADQKALRWVTMKDGG
jgi:hypothetical protein